MDFRDNKAIYVQIADWICEQVILGQWVAGDKISSVRELAVDLEVNPNTVARTFELLQNEGVVFQKRGIGLFVETEALDRALEYLRRDFVEKDMPRMFRFMKLLGISEQSMVERYREYLEDGSKK